MEFEQKSFKTTATGYCLVEDGIIYEINPIYGGQRQRVGVTDAKFQELKNISDEYYKKLVELGAITPPKSPEELQAETMQLMAGMFSEIKSLKGEMEALKNERTNTCQPVGDESAEPAKTQPSMGQSAGDISWGRNSGRSQKGS